MKYQGIESIINPETERDAILKFLDSYWNVKVNGEISLSTIVDHFINDGIQCGIALQEEETQRSVNSYNRLVDLANSKDENQIPYMDFIKSSSDDDITSGMKPLRIKQDWKIYAKPNDNNPEKLVFDGTPLHLSIAGNIFGFVDRLQPNYISTSSYSSLHLLAGSIFNQGITIGKSVVEQKYGTGLNIADQAIIACYPKTQ